MPLFTITTHNDNTLLYQDETCTFTQCLERAVEEQIDLSYANLANLNLSNANLDDARLNHANFSGSNLTGANLSEASLRYSDFSNAALFNTCLAYSDLSACTFKNTQFGATDIAASILDRSHFTGLSCYSLPFVTCKSMQGCVFETSSNGQKTLSKPPIVVYGLASTPLIISDSHVQKGHETPIPFPSQTQRAKTQP